MDQRGIKRLKVDDGRALLWICAPMDEASAAYLIETVVALARRIGPAIDALAGPGGSLDGHPEVQAGREAAARLQ